MPASTIRSVAPQDRPGKGPYPCMTVVRQRTPAALPDRDVERQSVTPCVQIQSDRQVARRALPTVPTPTNGTSASPSPPMEANENVSAATGHFPASDGERGNHHHVAPGGPASELRHEFRSTWPKRDVCTPVATRVILFATEPVRPAPIVAAHVVEKRAMFVAQRPDTCGQLMLKNGGSAAGST